MFEIVFCFIGVLAVCALIAYFFYRGLANLPMGIRLFIGGGVFLTLYIFFLIIGYELGNF